jgi:hypothetical protein
MDDDLLDCLVCVVADVSIDSGDSPESIAFAFHVLLSQKGKSRKNGPMSTGFHGFSVLT